MTARGALGALTVLLCAAACGVVNPQLDQADRSADTHARVAGQVMVRGLGQPVPVREAAAYVVGVGVDDAIDALRATGTTWRGSIVLRVQVTREHGTLSEQSTTRCYRYVFARKIEDYQPHDVPCPPGPTLSLTTPPPPPGVSESTVGLVRATLRAVPPAQRPAPGFVRAAVRHALGSGYQTTTYAEPTGVGIRVSSGDQCLTAHVNRAGAVDVSAPAHGTDCRGG